MKFQSLLFTLLFGFLGYSQSANIYTNSSTGNDLSGDGTQGNPYQTFHKAYQMVAAGGTIYLTGTFDWSSTNETGDSQPNGYGITKNLTIIGDSYQTTIIQAANSLASSNRRIFTLGASLTIWNVTLRYGKATYGGAISTSNGVLVNYTHSDIYSGTKALSLYNCSLNNNEITTGTSGFGAAVYIRDGAVIMDKCIVTNNTGVHAINVGGEGNGAGSINATNCYFADNHYYWTQNGNSFDWGAGLALWNGNGSICSGFATNCTFVSNGRGICPDRSRFTYTNCTFIGNGSAVSAYLGTHYFKNNVIVGGGIWLGENAPNSLATLVDGGFNYVSSSNKAFSQSSSVVGGNPTLNLDASPGLNSTFNITNTVAINSSSSVLIDAGSSTAHGQTGYLVTPPCTDQRGYMRNGTIDIGAFEYNGITTVPTTTVTGTLSPFNSYANIASSTQSFDVSGANLTANVVVTAPTGFQLSTSATGTFTSSLTLSHASGILANTTVFVRMLSATTPAIANITVVSACTDTKFIQVSGTVIIPVVTASPTTLTGFSSCLNTESAAQSTSISGSNLYTDITVTAPNGYEISLNSNTGYGASLTLTQTGGIVSATTVFVRLKASATAGTYNLNLTAASGSTTNIALTGTMNGNVTTTSTNLPNIFNYTVGATVTALTFTSNYVTTYQWYANTTNSTTGGTAISGATSATYTPPASATELGTKFYYCQATGCNTALSGVATVNVFRTYFSKASATDFNDINSWGLNTDGTGTAPSAIDNSGIFIIQNGSQLVLSANATVRALTINTGKLTVNSNSLTVSIYNQNNTELNVTNGGTLEINGGTVSVNGAVYFADGSGLTQTAGLLVLYPNSGTAATSLGGASGSIITFGIGYSSGSTNSEISSSTNALKFNCTGGTIQIVDPTMSSSTGSVCFAYKGSAGVYVVFGENHTVKFGNGSSTLAGGHQFGFLTNFRVGGLGYISFGNFVIDALTGTNRLVINAGGSICVTKNLTVTSGEYRHNCDTYISGNLTNEGTFWMTAGTLYFAQYANASQTPSTIAQTISGNGLFKNSVGDHNFNSVGFNNTSAGGVTFANANTLKSNVSYQGTISGWLTLTNGVINTGNGTLIHTQPNAISLGSGGFGPGSTYARLYTTAGTGTTITSGNIPSIGVGSYPFVSGNPVIGMKARYFHRSTANMSSGGLIAVKYVESPGLTALPSNITESTNTYDVQTNSSWIVTTTATITGNATYCIQNQDGFTTSTSNVIIVRNGVLVGSASGGSSSPMGQRTALTPGNQVGTFTLATSSPTVDMTWTGATSNDWATASNWSPAIVPSASNATIPATGITNFPVATNVTISAGKELNLLSGAQLTVNGILTNNGDLTIESGATLVQGASSTVAGTGTYNVNQTITGTNNGSAPNGRFWYLGSPVSLASSSVYFGNTANVLKKRNEAGNTWTNITSNAPENLVVGQGYYTQAMANSTVTFTGGVINNGNITISGLSRTAGQGFEGFNLVSNPYPSYLDWDAVTKTNVGNTMWYRTASGSTAASMVFETYVAGAAGGIGTNLSGNVATKWIPPMQSFWVRVAQGQTSGSLALDNTMRAHFTSVSGSTAGLRSTNDELKLFLRMNLLQADKKDQLIVYVNGNASNGFDVLDGEKMMQAVMPQFYTSAAGKKITINGLNSAKKQQSLPVTMELPTTGVHSFVIEDLDIDNGLVWLEDKQEEIMQALEPGTVYEFYANSGINAERFVLHFQLIDDAVPTNVYNEVNSSANFSGKGASVHAESAGVVVIKLPASTEGITDIQIRDAAGRVVYTGSTNALETSVQLSQANGIYYVTLNSNAGVEVRKVFVQQ